MKILLLPLIFFTFSSCVDKKADLVKIQKTAKDSLRALDARIRAREFHLQYRAEDSTKKALRKMADSLSLQYYDVLSYFEKRIEGDKETAVLKDRAYGELGILKSRQIEMQFLYDSIEMELKKY